ncbi:hypothetical protein AB0N09_21875 [Streptomyces erythrochromogenes]|uniref:hypothetical protein n=1 Tax=Streptomyces erythrochromogenes TaxID=285574 RepID=UPI003420115E
MTDATVYTTGTAYGLLLLAPARLPVGTAGGLTAEWFCDLDTPGAPPVVSVWAAGLDAELDGPGVDALLDRVDAFAVDLRRLRALLRP